MDHEERLKAALADRYQVEGEVGSGGMATVYLGQDLKHDRKVAVKVLKPELAAVMGTERFLTEIRTTANLSHPHPLPVSLFLKPIVNRARILGAVGREGTIRSSI